MQKIFLKALNVFTYLLHPRVPYKLTYFIRDNYFSRLVQTRFLIKDHLFKKPYKSIEFFGEFQQELTFVLPFAYWHHLNGTLKQTVSSKGTQPLYFFSEDHKELPSKRDWFNNAINYTFPNMTHSNSFSYRKWKQVPLKEYYRNNIFVFEKPILIIANKYNIEWKDNPINFFDIETLDKVINHYKDRYQIIYNRPLATQIVGDESEILDLGEYEWMKKNHHEVILMNDLFEKYSHEYSFNQLQLMVYANSERFLSVHGGTAALASYFGGINIIYSIRGLEHIFNEFNTIFPKLSDAKILHAKSKEQILGYVQEHF